MGIVESDDNLVDASGFQRRKLVGDDIRSSDEGALERLRAALETKKSVRRVWPSVANFLLVDFADPEATLAAARAAKLLIRDMRAAAGALRISVGTPEQNDRLIRSLT